MSKIKAVKSLLKLLMVILIFMVAFNPKSEAMASSKSISLNKTSAMLKVGKTLKLTVSNAPSTVKWSTDNKKIATVQNGLVTAKSAGTANIKARSGSKTVTCKITVYQPAKKVVLKPDSEYIEVGDTFKVTAQITPEDATYKTLTWSVDNEYYWYPAIEQVSKNKFKAIGEGKATIIAYQKNTKKYYKLEVEVKDALGPFHIEANGQKVTSLTTFVGGHAIISGVMDNANKYWYDEEKEFKYSIKDTNIALVDDRGQITALAAGTTSVIVTAENGKSVSCKLVVTQEKKALAIDTFYADNIFSRVGLGNYGNWSNWSNADNTYIIKLNDQICLLNHISKDTSQSIEVYFYDQKLNYLKQKTMELPYTEWGGFYQGEDGYYYAAVGQTNEEQDDSKTVFSIIKMDSDFKEIGRCNITGAECSTRIPYDVGFARMTMDGTTLIVHTDRERYTSSDGLNHQSNITFVIDTTTMKQYYVGALFPYNHVSHSFNQFVKMDGKNLIYLDHGDAYPRSVVMQTHYNFSLYGWSDTYRSRPATNSLDLLDIVGATGNNYTGTKVNGFEIGTSHNIVAGVSIPHDTMTVDELVTSDVKNVYISLASKDGSESELVWLTDYQSGGGISAENLRMVKITEDKFALIYQIDKGKSDSTGLIIIDSNGKVLEKKEYDIFFSCYTQPIYYDNSILWIDSTYSSWDYWYEDTNKKIEQCQFTRIYL